MAVTPEEFRAYFYDTVVPGMLDEGWALIAAKGGEHFEAYTDQSLLAHVISGVEASCSLRAALRGLDVGESVFTDTEFVEALRLYCAHDVHKLAEGAGDEFGIPRETIEGIVGRLGLNDPALGRDISWREFRAGMIHLRSSQRADAVTLEPVVERWVRWADAMASATSLVDGADALRWIADHLATGGCRLEVHYHRLGELRAALGPMIHSAVAERIAQNGAHPVLFYPEGSLYLSHAGAGMPSAGALYPAVAKSVILRIGATHAGTPATDLVPEAYRQKHDFEGFVYLLATPAEILASMAEGAVGRASSRKNWWKGEFPKIMEALHDSPDVVASLGLEPDPGTADQAMHGAYHIIAATDAILKQAFSIEDDVDRVGKIARALRLPAKAGEALSDAELLGGNRLSKGGVRRYCSVLAWAFVRRGQLNTQAPEEVVREATALLSPLLGDADGVAERVAQDLGYEEDLTEYCAEQLVLSWGRCPPPTDGRVAAHLKVKTASSHASTCALCGRLGHHNRPMTAGVLRDQVRVYSSRVLASAEAPEGNRYWCPTCELEFVLRLVTGLTYTKLSYGTIRRLHIYLMPDYCFGPRPAETLQDLAGEIRCTGIDWADRRERRGAPGTWVEARVAADELGYDRYLRGAWLDGIRQVASRVAEAGWGPEVLLTTSPELSPNYCATIWEGQAGNVQGQAGPPVDTELWAKAAFLGTMAALISGCRVIVTERPYLSASEVLSTPALVTLDGASAAVLSVLGGRRSGHVHQLRLRDAPQALDLLASAWLYATADRERPHKRITEVLSQVRSNPLAAARLYREFERQTGHEAGTGLTQASWLLLRTTGGDLMSLAERVADLCLRIFLPNRMWPGRPGKAHSYEDILRTAVDGLERCRRRGMSSLEGVKEGAAGYLGKHVSRRATGGIRTPRGEDLADLCLQLVTLLYDDVLMAECGGSWGKFRRLENCLADAVYFLTDQWADARREEWHQRRAQDRSEADGETKEGN